MTPLPTVDSGAEIAASGLVRQAVLLGRAKWAILGFDLVVTLAVAGGSLLVPNTFTARTLLLPPQQGQSATGSALATLGVLTAGLSGSAIKSPEEMYVSLLRSDSVGDTLVERFKLKEHYGHKTLADTRQVLSRHVTVTPERKSGLIRVEVEDHDPEFAAKLANSYSEELRRLMDRIAVTEASQRRLFFEEQTRLAKAALAKAELEFKAAQDRFGIQSIDTRAQVDIRAASELRAQMIVREVQLQAMRGYAGPEHPEAQRLASEIASLKAQLNKLEHGSGTDSPSSATALANQRAYREVKYQEAIVSGLITQTELARADEARQAPLVQQVDVARTPDRKTSPRRVIWTIVAFFGGLIGCAAHILVVDAWRRGAMDPEVRRGREAIRSAWKLSRS